MIEELATVVAIDKTDVLGEKRITVESQVKSACSSCHQLDTCGSGQISKAIPQRKMSVVLLTDLPVVIGDTLVVGLSEKSILQSAWQVYLWPLLGLILCSALGQWLVLQGIFLTELYAVGLGVIGGYAGYRFAKFWLSYTKQSQALIPKVLRIQSNTISCPTDK